MKGGREREDSHLYAVLMDRWRDETNWVEEGLDEERKQSAVFVWASGQLRCLLGSE